MHLNRINPVMIQLIFLILIVTTISVYTISKETENTVKGSIQDKLISNANITASNIKLDSFNRIRPGGENTSYFLEIRDFLHRTEISDPRISSVYTMRKNGTNVEFVVDADYGYNNNSPNVGYIYDVKQVYKENEPEIIRGFLNPIADQDFATDQWGTTMSGFAPIRGSNGTVVGIVGVDMDSSKIIAELNRLNIILYSLGSLAILSSIIGIILIERRREKAELVIQESEMRLRFALESLEAAEWDLNLKDGTIVRSASYDRLFGYESNLPDWTYPILLDSIIPSDQTQIIKAFQSIQDNKERFAMECRILRKDGIIRWLRISGQPHFDREGNADRVVGLCFDITEQKLMEEEILSSLKEKEILLHEIHHRVKNNMQIISSLISMQIRTIPDESVRILLMESQSRIRSIAIVYEYLHQFKDLALIESGPFIRGLYSSLADLYSIQQSRISINIKDMSAGLSLMDAVPCSLIIRELMSNSIKHAFPGDMRGKICISMRFHPETKEYTLMYHDNGVGIPVGLDLKRVNSIGMQLIFGLTKQLGGTIQIESKDGFSIKISFPSTYQEKNP